MAEQPIVFVVVLLLAAFSLRGSWATVNSSCKDKRLQDLMHTSAGHQCFPLVPYCIKGHSSIHPFCIWSSIKVDLDFDIVGSQLFQADSCEKLQEVRSRTFAKHFLAWFADPNAITSKSFHISPFGVTCFDISSKKNLSGGCIKITFEAINWHLPFSLIMGLMFFLEADMLSRSATFFYGSGILLGVVFSLLLAVFLLHRLVPSKGGAYALLAGGWSVCLYLLQWTWNNLVDLVLNKNPIVIWYFTVAGVISFCLCYYNGPVTNERGIDLIRWTIQLIASYFIYKGVQPESLSLAVVITVILGYAIKTSSLNVIDNIFYILPKSWVSYKIRYYFFPPPKRLLTAEEFDAQGKEETQRALLQLREYCSSPECNTWKIMSRIQNPKRFCAFVSEGFHITDDEYEKFEDNPFEYSRPEEHDDDDDESEANRYFERYT